MGALEQARRELERQRAGAPQVHVCELHGEHITLVCMACYAIQQERVERESMPLRYANTAPALRQRVAEQRATMNGHG